MTREEAINRIFKRMWNCRGEHTTSIDKVKMEQIIREEMTREEAYNRIDAIITKYEIDDEYVTITNSMDYDALRMARELLEQEPKTGHCKNCKWWKDSDGAYRRGAGAESQCLINRREVLEGNGYCFLFEPHESEDKDGKYGI